MGSVYEPLFEAVFEALPCEIVVHDGEYVVLANAAACHAFGATSPRGLIGLPLSALIHLEDPVSAEQRWMLVAGQNRPFPTLPLRFTELSGDTFTIGATVRGFSVGERAFAVVARSRSSSPLVEPTEDVIAFSEGTPLAKATLDALLQPIGVYDAEDCLLFSNAAARQLFCAKHHHDLTGQPLSAIIHPHTLDAAKERRMLVLDRGQSFPHIEAKLKNLDGETIHAVGSLGGAGLPNGARVGYWMGHSTADASFT